MRCRCTESCRQEGAKLVLTTIPVLVGAARSNAPSGARLGDRGPPHGLRFDRYAHPRGQRTRWRPAPIPSSHLRALSQGRPPTFFRRSESGLSCYSSRMSTIPHVYALALSTRAPRSPTPETMTLAPVGRGSWCRLRSVPAFGAHRGVLICPTSWSSGPFRVPLITPRA